MKKSIKKGRVILIPVCIIILFAAGILIGKQYMGMRIRHYKQYIFPCQGQIVTPKGGAATIRFEVMDEEEHSELAEKSNIKKILLTTETGEQIEAEDWEIGEGVTTAHKYVARILYLSVSTEQEFTIRELTIVYPDTKETFDIGNLKVCPIDQPYWIQMWGECFDYTPDSDNPYDRDEESGRHSLDATAVSVFGRLGSDRESVTIRRIDFGIPGLGMDPDSVRLEQGEDLEMGMELMSFMSQPENEIYTRGVTVETLSDQDINLEITEPTFRIWAAAQKSGEYNDRMVSLYIAPVYYCIDPVTQEEVVYGDWESYYIASPKMSFLSGQEDEMLTMIQEQGK